MNRVLVHLVIHKKKYHVHFFLFQIIHKNWVHPLDEIFDDILQWSSPTFSHFEDWFVYGV